MTIQDLVSCQHLLFNTNYTKKFEVRKKALLTLQNWIQNHEADIEDALKADLNKSTYEAYLTEVSVVQAELAYMLKNLMKFAKPQHVCPALSQFPATCFTIKEPYGVLLIMTPWNYPFQLSLVPLIGAIATGNCVIIKPSHYAPATANLIARMTKECFAENHVATVIGSRAENQLLLDQKFDFIFFTGSTTVGRVVMEKAAKNLTPICLELGGKSPCIVDATANISLAAKRIVFGKILNAGQTCIAPDYVYVEESVKAELIDKIKKYIRRFLGHTPLENPNYPKIINEKHFQRLLSLTQSGDVILGGEGNSRFQIAPTLLDNVSTDSPIMKEEIFGPLLPILPFKELDEVISYIKSNGKPLALYLFSRNRYNQRRILNELSFGGGCINDTLLHIASHNLPFGGVGASGMGKYHGKYSFSLFSHEKSILKKHGSFDIPLRYPPYYKIKEKIVKRFL